MDFYHSATEDSVQGFRYGIECLFRFYSYGIVPHAINFLFKFVDFSLHTLIIWVELPVYETTGN